MQECTETVFHCISEWTLCFKLQFSQDLFNTTELFVHSSHFHFFMIQFFQQHRLKFGNLPVTGAVPVVLDGCVSGACVHLFIHD
jgi:hypothetical protein